MFITFNIYLTSNISNINIIMKTYTTKDIDKVFNSRIETRFKINVENMLNNINNTANCTIIPLGKLVHDGNTYTFGINIYKGNSNYFVDTNNMFVISNNIAKNVVVNIFEAFETISSIRNKMSITTLYMLYNISFIF